ncbi:MAG TPA: hypothetical protein VGA45_11330, partial [Actinomycetota bacterium]
MHDTRTHSYLLAGHLGLGRWQASSGTIDRPGRGRRAGAEPALGDGDDQGDEELRRLEHLASQRLIDVAG